MNLNSISLVGNLTRDPESFSEGSICSFGIAVNRRWKSQDGEQREEVMFIDVKVFGKTAGNVQKYLKKGAQVGIVGRLSQENWEDKNTGQKRSKHVIVADPFGISFGNKKDSEEGGSGGSTSQTSTSSEPASKPSGGQKPADEINYDDIPF